VVTLVQVHAVHWMLLNGITLGQTITDPINQMVTITKYVYYTKYAFKRHLGLVQSGSV